MRLVISMNRWWCKICCCWE